MRHFVLLALVLTSPALGARSVYRVSPAIDGPIIAGTLLAGWLPYAYASKLIHPRCPCDPGEVNGFDRGAIGNRSSLADTLSDVTVAAAILVPAALDVHELGLGSELVEDLVVLTETLAINGAFVVLAKFTAQRPLPRTYENDPELVGSPGGYRSFYSGHTSTVFAALGAASMTAALRHHAGAWPWVLTGAVGASVGIERVLAGRHFPTDVIVGAIAGTAVGVAVPWLHRREGPPTDAVAIVPFGEGWHVVWARTL